MIRSVPETPLKLHFVTITQFGSGVCTSHPSETFLGLSGFWTW